MERLRALSGAQRFLLVLLGTAVANIGRVLLDGLLGMLVIAVGFVAVLAVLGLVELAVWALRTLQRRIDLGQQVNET